MDDNVRSYQQPEEPSRNTGYASEVDELLTPGQVAKLFGVDPKTVTRWASAGKLTALHTLGGHRRYRAREVHELLERHRQGG